MSFFFAFPSHSNFISNSQVFLVHVGPHLRQQWLKAKRGQKVTLKVKKINIVLYFVIDSNVSSYVWKFFLSILISFIIMLPNLLFFFLYCCIRFTTLCFFFLWSFSCCCVWWREIHFRYFRLLWLIVCDKKIYSKKVSHTNLLKIQKNWTLCLWNDIIWVRV